MRLKLRREVKSPEVDLGVASIEMVGLPGGSDGKESACSAGDTGISLPNFNTKRIHVTVLQSP